eukprot:GHVU01178326.1.p1 GENE.GHVU01178326.1~~GHVU01178326.1.p1  ORF type:complete len:108 (+),score=9.14 GHVU01178326.1:1382-1705(+)
MVMSVAPLCLSSSSSYPSTRRRLVADPRPVSSAPTADNSRMAAACQSQPTSPPPTRQLDSWLHNGQPITHTHTHDKRHSHTRQTRTGDRTNTHLHINSRLDKFVINE